MCIAYPSYIFVPAALRPKRAFDRVEIGAFGLDKRSFDRLEGSAGDFGLNKRSVSGAFDRLDFADFGLRRKRAFDRIARSEFGLRRKRSFDRLARSEFGLIKRNDPEMSSSLFEDDEDRFDREEAVRDLAKSIISLRHQQEQQHPIEQQQPSDQLQ
ncbi:unnamed protein product [Auanema sp. JU1783]|nr:unnamed protein product [Auanema sp. JU1783]